jgi:hypothetical protein
MGKTALLAGTAMFALASSGVLAAPHPATVARAINHQPIQSKGSTLYNQNSNYDYAIVSQNFTSGSMGTAYDAAAADDFVVPRGKTWKVTGVDAAGVYFYGSGPASSEVITFYKNNQGHPGDIVGKPQTVVCTDSAGNFACKILGVKLNGGKRGTRYWLSVVANCSYDACGEWGWTQTSTHNRPGQWENPGGAFGTTCSTWNNTSTCLTQSGVVDDYAFALKGKSS